MAYKLSKSAKKTKTKRSKIILIGLIIVYLLGVGGFFGYKYFFVNKKQGSTDNINYNPPTQQEQQSGDKQKQKITEEQDKFKDREGEVSQRQNSDNNPPNTQATVIITDTGQYDNIVEVRAFVPNHYEDGSCKITLTKGSLKVEKETSAYRDVSTTICTNPLIARNEFASSGDWEVVVNYTAHGASGTSNAKVVHLK